MRLGDSRAIHKSTESLSVHSGSVQFYTICKIMKGLIKFQFLHVQDRDLAKFKLTYIIQMLFISLSSLVVIC